MIISTLTDMKAEPQIRLKIVAIFNNCENLSSAQLRLVTNQIR